jgi:hypothetical protein
MNNQLHFINEQWLWPALCIAFLLLLLFIWTVWKGSFNRDFFINSTVGVLAVIALLFLFLRPTRGAEVSGSALLLTQGYTAEQFDSIKKQQNNVKVIKYNTGVDFSSSLDSIGQVTILGQGLRAFDFWQLEGIPTCYIKGDMPKGIVKLNYPKQHRIGDLLFINGVYHQPVLGNRLVLQSSSGEGLDSIVFDSDENFRFKFDSYPKTSGKYVYQLIEKDSAGKILDSSPLPLMVLKKQVLRIFISNQSPSFETKYLKNFLSEEGHELVVRSQITKGRFKFEYFNTPRSPLEDFLEKDLKKFDLLILDTDTFLSLSKGTKQSIVNVIREYGTGVFVQPNEALFRTANGMVDFGFERDGKDKISTFNRTKVQLEKYPYAFEDRKANGIVIENYTYALVLGKGRLSTTVLSNTYQLLLDGKSIPYREVWSKIIEAAARPQEAVGVFETSDSFVFQDIPYSFTLSTALEKPMVQQSDDYSLPLIKDLVLEDRWHGTTYSVQKGWQSLAMQGDTSLVMDYFVMDTIQWKSVIGANMILENSRVFNPSDKLAVNRITTSEVPRWGFFLVFFCCMVYLWLIPKLKA